MRNFIWQAYIQYLTFHRGNALWVRLGITKLTDRHRRQEIKIAERIPHPEYRVDSHYNDIGLLRLEKAARLNSFSRPACLYLDSEIRSERAIATGWGYTSYGGNTSNDLLKVVLDLFNQSTCSQYYQNHRRVAQGILDNLQVCAGSVKGNNDTCQVIYQLFTFFLYTVWIFPLLWIRSFLVFLFSTQFRVDFNLAICGSITHGCDAALRHRLAP